MFDYDFSKIKVLKGLEGVKKRPGMYIGDTSDGTGLHRLIFEIVDNSMDEVLGGHCDVLNVCLNNDNSVIVKDNGRGIPTDFHIFEDKMTIEVIMTTLHSGGKFDNTVYKVSSGLHGVGISVVNALSDYVYICVFRNGFVYRQNYLKSFIHSDLIKVSTTFLNGTLIKFKPSSYYFNNISFNFNVLDQRFKELCFLNLGIKIVFSDKRKKKKKLYFFDGGIKSFIQKITLNKVKIGNVLFFSDTKNDVFVECALQWTNTHNENILCYTNNVRQKDGGSHMSGLKSALTKTFGLYMENYFFLKKNKIYFSGEDIREGLVSILSIKLLDPKFSSQTKDKLVSHNVKFIVESIISKNLYNYLINNSNSAKNICNRIYDSYKAREAARKAKDIIRKKEFLEVNKLFGRLARCQVKDPVYAELFLVEGDSAGGSAKQARSRENQAILPLKGKILNVEKASIDKLLSSAEISLLISVLGCGIGDKDYDFLKLKYHTIIIMTDADVDGLHIKTLLLTFFYKYMKDLILRGCIYVAQPPLYRLKKGSLIIYFNDVDCLTNYLFNNILSEIRIFSKNNNKILFYEDIKNIFDIYVKMSFFIDKLLIKYPKEILEALFFVFKLDGNLFFKLDVLYDYKNALQLYFDKYYLSKDLYFLVDIFEGKIKISLCKYSFFNDYFFSSEFFESEDYEMIFVLGNKIKYLIEQEFYIQKEKKYYKIMNFIRSMEWIKNESKLGFNLQRYKGLGEMNPVQLWETTMNPKNRCIIKIKFDGDKKIDNVFSMLMGDDVYERKKFINDNAMYAKDIDI